VHDSPFTAETVFFLAETGLCTGYREDP
jgi:hypothetical protein